MTKKKRGVGGVLDFGAQQTLNLHPGFAVY